MWGRLTLGLIDLYLSETTGYPGGISIYERCVSMSSSRTRLSKRPMSSSLYFVDVELIQIEKTELYCAMFFRSLRCC